MHLRTSPPAQPTAGTTTHLQAAPNGGEVCGVQPVKHQVVRPPAGCGSCARRGAQCMQHAPCYMHKWAPVQRGHWQAACNSSWPAMCRAVAPMRCMLPLPAAGSLAPAMPRTSLNSPTMVVFGTLALSDVGDWPPLLAAASASSTCAAPAKQPWHRGRPGLARSQTRARTRPSVPPVHAQVHCPHAHRGDGRHERLEPQRLLLHEQQLGQS